MIKKKKIYKKIRKFNLKKYLKRRKFNKWITKYSLWKKKFKNKKYSQ